jgi:signal peptidase II
MAVPRNRYIAFFTIAAVGVLADLWTKAWIFGVMGLPSTWRGSPVWWLWDGRVGFQTSLNEGALFGMGQGKVWLFAVLACVLLVFVVLWFFRGGGAQSRWMTVALAFVTAGILGNLYDRLALHGLLWEQIDLDRTGPARAVRDWILVMIGNYPWPNFNIADSLLVAGVIMLMWHSIRAKEPWGGGVGPSETPNP